MIYYLNKGKIVARSYQLQNKEFIFDVGTQFKKRSSAMMGDGFFATYHSCCHNSKALKNEIKYWERKLNTSLVQEEVCEQDKQSFIEKMGV